MARRQFRQPRVGDLNIRPELPKTDPILPDERLDLDDYSTDELINMLLTIAPEKALELVSIEKCQDHWDKKWQECGGNELRYRYQVAVDIVFCKQCWLWFRYNKSTKEAKYYNEQPTVTVYCDACSQTTVVKKSETINTTIICGECKQKRLDEAVAKLQGGKVDSHIHGVHRGNRK